MTKICEKHGLPIDITTFFHRDKARVDACWACIGERDAQARKERLLWQLLDQVQQEKIRRLKEQREEYVKSDEVLAVQGKKV